MGERQRPFVGGMQPLDDDPTRRLVVDVGPDSIVDPETARIEYEAPDDGLWHDRGRDEDARPVSGMQFATDD